MKVGCCAHPEARPLCFDHPRGTTVSDGLDETRPVAPAAWQPPVDPTAGSGAPSPYRPAPQVGGATWTAPSQPGLIPLRPLTLGTLLSGSFRTLRRNPRPLLGFALGSQVLVVVLSAVVTGISLAVLFTRLENVSAENADQVTAGGVFGIILASLVPAVLGVIVVALLQGIVVLEVTRATLGEKLTLRQLWRRARGRLWALTGWMLLLVLAMSVAIAIVAGLVVVVVVLMGELGVPIGVLLGIVGALGFTVLGVWLGTKLSLVPSALMVERLSLRAAVRRSWRLTDRYFWRTFGVQALVAVILSVAMQVIATPVSVLLPMLSLLLDPTGSNADLALAVFVGVYLLLLALFVAMGAVTMVVQSATNGLIYLDLRMRKEGLELDLARYVEQRDAGVTELDDPYLPSTSPAGTTRGWQSS